VPNPSTDREVIEARFDEAELSSDRYVSVQDGEKKCIDHDTRYDAPPDGNYGVYCDADDRLVVLDVDDYDDEGVNPGLAAVEALPETLAEQSPHGGTHYYYRVRMSEGRMPATVLEDVFGIKNPTASWGEIQVANKYVLAAGCELDGCKKEWHDCSEEDEGHYKITNDEEIAEIDAETLVEVLAADPDVEREDMTDNSGDDGRDDGESAEDWVEQRLELAREKSDELDRLMDGNYSDFRDSGGVDRSAAEASLAARLAFWLEGDLQAVEQVIEHDARTKKWDERGDSYRESVMDAAKQVNTYYDPQHDVAVEPEVDDEEIEEIDEEERWESAREEIRRIMQHYEGHEEVEIEIGQQRMRERVANVLKRYWNWLYPTGGDEPVMGWADEVLYWRNPETGVYQMNGEAKVEEMVEKLLAHHSTDATVREITNKVARKSFTSRDEIKAREPPEHHVVVGNGVIDLEEGELIDPDPDTLYRHRVPVNYDPDAECEYIDARFREWVDEEHVATLYRVAAHCIYPGYPTKRVALLPGEGDNGKGMYIDTLNALVGSQNVVHRGLGDLSGYQFAMEDLEGKLANLEGDLSPEEIQDTGPLKKLTGSDAVTADVKQQSSIKFENKATLVAAVNTVPELPEDNHAIWSRWLYIPFSNKFVGDEKIPEHKLRRNLTSEEQLKGLLRRAVDELLEWWQNDDRPFYPGADGPDEVREQMLNAARPLRDFATTAFKTVDEPGDPDDSWSGKDAAYGKVMKKRVVEAYEEYAEQEGLPRMNSQKLKDQLQELAEFDIQKGQTKALTDTATPDQCFKGIEWTPRGAQLAGIEHPDADDAQDALDDVDEMIPGDVSVERVREYIGENPDADVYEVMREFALDGEAFDAVQKIVEGVDPDGEDDEDDDDDEGGIGDVGNDGDGGDGGNDGDASNVSDDGDDEDITNDRDGGVDPDGIIPSKVGNTTREEIREMVEDGASADEVMDEHYVPPHEEQYVHRAVARWGYAGGDDGDASPPRGLNAPDVAAEVPTRAADEDADQPVDFDEDEIGEEDDTVLPHREAGDGSDVDVVVVRESEYSPAIEMSYPQEVDIHIVPDEGGDQA